MKTFVLGLALGVAAVGGVARGDTFAVVPSSIPSGLPSADVPNAPGALLLPLRWTSPPALPLQRSYSELLDLWQRAGAAYGIPWQVLAAINKVESNFGGNMGPSSAGAIGWMQFMPSTWLRWGLDANGDGVADPWNPDDAVYAAARYLAASGGRTDIQRAVFSYNHAQWYVDEVLGLARVYDQGTATAASFENVQAELSAARGHIATASKRLDAALADARRLEGVEARLRLREAGAPLLSDQLALEQRAVQVDVRRQAALAEADAARSDLQTAQTDLMTAQQHASAPQLASAGTLLGQPAVSGGWVFPVGGGAGLVSVSHHHHNYPAADIAAPAGSPVYALAAAIVGRAWQQPDPRCGIGLTLQTGDGRSWTYCHLSALDPAVRVGTFLDAGAQVGLVGMTGEATGPHLHLQLDPPTSYPQNEPWFQSFAGSAFTWQDGGGRQLAARTPHAVFAVVGTPQPDQGSALAFTR